MARARTSVPPPPTHTIVSLLDPSGPLTSPEMALAWKRFEARLVPCVSEKDAAHGPVSAGSDEPPLLPQPRAPEAQSAANTNILVIRSIPMLRGASAIDVPHC